MQPLLGLIALFVSAPAADVSVVDDEAPSVVAQAEEEVTGASEAALDDSGEPAGFFGDTNGPREFGSGYQSWGVNGGATLGHGNGVRGHLGVRGSPYGVAIFNPEAFFILGMSEDFDLGIGGYVGFIGWLGGFGLAFAPEGLLRYRLLGAGEQFQLAIEATAGPIFWVGSLPAVGAQAVPGVTASYFVKDNMEIFFGGLLPITILGLTSSGVVNWSFAVDLRGGFAYTLKMINLGFFAQVDVLIGGAAASIGRFTATSAYFTVYGNLGVQYRF